MARTPGMSIISSPASIYLRFTNRMLKICQANLKCTQGSPTPSKDVVTMSAGPVRKHLFVLNTFSATYSRVRYFTPTASPFVLCEEPLSFLLEQMTITRRTSAGLATLSLLARTCCGAIQKNASITSRCLKPRMVLTTRSSVTRSLSHLMTNNRTICRTLIRLVSGVD